MEENLSICVLRLGKKRKIFRMMEGSKKKKLVELFFFPFSFHVKVISMLMYEFEECFWALASKLEYTWVRGNVRIAIMDVALSSAFLLGNEISGKLHRRFYAESYEFILRSFQFELLRKRFC